MATELAVLGSPIAHSKSPALHLAAYRELGLDWQYSAIEVGEHELAGFIESRDPAWRGLSLTMPLKRAVLPLLHTRDELVELTGTANTLLLQDGRRRGFNTDVHGITESFTRAGIDRIESAQLLGAGATAASALVALSRLGATRVLVAARSVEKARDLLALGERLGVTVTVREFGSHDEAAWVPDAVVSTLPNGALVDVTFPLDLRGASVLFDVAYEPWPSALATQWSEARGTVISGLEMLVHQAVAQLRIFTGGDPEAPLPDESRVLAAMRTAVGLG